MLNKSRVPVAVIGIIIIYFFIRWGGFAFFLLVTGLSVGAAVEFYRMCDLEKIPSIKWLGILCILLLLSNTYFLTSGNPGFNGNITSVIFVFSVVGIFAVLLFRREIKDAVLISGITLFPVIYIGWLITHMIFLRQMKPFGYEFMLMAIAVTWFSDMGAYSIGTRFGRKKLHIASPNKSRLGALSSLIFGGLAAIGMRYILGLDFITIPKTILLGVLIGGATVFGDLSESLIKRSLRQKDSGRFLPSHGGILDKIDSHLFTVPLVYYYVRWFVL